MTRLTLPRAAALAAAAIASLLLAGPAQAGADVTVLESNIAGGTECPLDVNCLKYLNWQITIKAPDVVAGEEFCAVHRDELAAKHPELTVFFQSFRVLHAGCGIKGQVLAGPGLHDPEVYDLPGDYGNHAFAMLCARTADGPRACVVHLAAGADRDDVRAAQVDAILAVTATWGRHFLAGDLNLGSGTGTFRRLVVTGYDDLSPGRVTHVLVKGRTAAESGKEIAQPTSDHPILRGSVTWP